MKKSIVYLIIAIMALAGIYLLLKMVVPASAGGGFLGIGGSKGAGGGKSGNKSGGASANGAGGNNSGYSGGYNGYQGNNSGLLGNNTNVGIAGINALPGLISSIGNIFGGGGSDGSGTIDTSGINPNDPPVDNGVNGSSINPNDPPVYNDPNSGIAGDNSGNNTTYYDTGSGLLSTDPGSYDTSIDPSIDTSNIA